MQKKVRKWKVEDKVNCKPCLFCENAPAATLCASIKNSAGEEFNLEGKY